MSSGRSRDEPFPADWSVERGLRAYVEENGFTVEAYDAPWTPASLVGIRFGVPNTARHRWAIRLHDLHHVATGYGTDPAGEGQISAWECRRGVRRLGLYVGTIVVSSVLLGLLLAPIRTLRAWRASGRFGSLFHDDRDYPELLAMTIGDLRARLGVPKDGLASGRRGLHSLAPER